MYQRRKEEEPQQSGLPFAESAKEVMRFAQEETFKWGQDAVCPECLLLGLTREEIIRQRLIDLKIDPAKVPYRVQFLTGWKKKEDGVRQPEGVAPFPLTRDARAVIQLAELDARKYNLSEITSTHLLRAIIKQEGTITAGVLISFELNPGNMFWKVPAPTI